MVVAREGRCEAVGRWDAPFLHLDPLGSVGLALRLVPPLLLVVPDLGDVERVVPVHVGRRGVSGDAHVLVLHVLRLGLVVAASGSLRWQYGDILPGSGRPVGVEIALLGALQAIAVVGVSVGVLASSLSRRGGSSCVLICQEESCVAVALSACVVPRQGLVLSTYSSQESIVCVVSNSVAVVVSNGVRSSLLGSVANPRAAHVLQDHVAVYVVVSRAASVLHGPLDLQERSLVVGHRVSPLVASLRVVLRVEETVLVLSILILLIQLVVRSARGVEVAISRGGSQKACQDQHDQC